MKEQKHWAAYGMEALCLFGFVLLAGLLTIFFEHPDMPVMQSSWKHYPWLRRVPVGLLIGLYIFLITKAFGKKSGALANPAITWTLARLGHINLKDTFWYTVAQFVGASLAALLLKWTLYDWFGHPNIHFGVTKPIPPHDSKDALVAECIISFLTMSTILYFNSLKKLEKYLPVVMGVWLALFIIVEMPYSGMSMNPARSFAGALAANKWEHLWIYFVAPGIVMLLTGELYLLWKKGMVKKEIRQPKKGELQRLKDYPAMQDG
jgi:aquaporin Z